MTDYAVRWKRSTGNTYFNNGASNGCVISGSPRTVSATSGTGSVVTITTSTAHSYVVGQVVTISGVVPSGYNGKVVIRSVTSTTFTYDGPTTGSMTTAGTVTPTTEFFVDALNSSEAPTVGVQYDINVAVVSLGSVGTWSAADVNSQVTPVDATVYTPPASTSDVAGTTVTASDGSSTAGWVTGAGGWSGIKVVFSNASWTTATCTFTFLGKSYSTSVSKAASTSKTTLYFTVPRSVSVSVAVSFASNKNNFTVNISPY